MGVALADEPGVEVVSVQEDVAKPAPVAVYGVSGAVLLEHHRLAFNRDRRLVAADLGDDESDRVGFLDSRSHLQPRQVLATGRSPRALGRRESLAGGEKFPASQGVQTTAEITGGTRPAEHAASGSGRSGVNYNLRRAASFNGDPDILCSAWS